MRKIAKMQAKVNALKHGDTAAITFDTVIPLIAAVIVISAILFIVFKHKA